MAGAQAFVRTMRGVTEVDVSELGTYVADVRV
jgi:hypothetical protein